MLSSTQWGSDSVIMALFYKSVDYMAPGSMDLPVLLTIKNEKGFEVNVSDSSSEP